MSQGLIDESFKYHLINAKNNKITKEEIAEIITHAAFYVGWPKAWAAFNIAKEVWNEELTTDDKKVIHSNKMIFPIGQPNDEFAKYFVGNSYLAPVSTDQIMITNVTFEPSCRNNWHIHKASKGGGQILVCIAGHGYYQEWGKDVINLHPGDVINIPANIKHWHGATNKDWFSHLAVEVPAEDGSTEWLEAVDNEFYNGLD